MSKEEKKRLGKKLRAVCLEYAEFIAKTKKHKTTTEVKEEEEQPSAAAVATAPKKQAKTFEEVKAICEKKDWDLSALNKDELKVVIKHHNAKDKQKRVIGGKKEELIDICNKIDDLWE